MPKGLKGFQLKEKNPMWKGNKVGMSALHEWIMNRKPKPKLCECCKTNKIYDLANISGKYRRDIKDFEWLCRKCHMTKDGRMKNLKRDTLSGKDNPNYRNGKYIKK